MNNELENKIDWDWLSPLWDESIPMEMKKDAIRTLYRTAYTAGQNSKHEEIALRLNKVMNKHSKSISEGGLDYVSAFKAMEKLEHELFMEMSRSLAS